MNIPRPVALRMALTAGTIVPFGFSLAALWPSSSFVAPTLYGAAVGVGLPLWRQRALLRLNRGEYETMRAVVRSGRPSGQPQLDDLARDQLADSGSPTRSDRVTLAILLLALFAVPVADAFLRSTWWLFAIVPVPAAFWVVKRHRTELPPAEERLRILLAEMEPG